MSMRLIGQWQMMLEGWAFDDGGGNVGSDPMSGR